MQQKRIARTALEHLLFEVADLKRLEHTCFDTPHSDPTNRRLIQALRDSAAPDRKSTTQLVHRCADHLVEVTGIGNFLTKIRERFECMN